jgi:hypothetical protein
VNWNADGWALGQPAGNSLPGFGLGHEAALGKQLRAFEPSGGGSEERGHELDAYRVCTVERL